MALNLEKTLPADVITREEAKTLAREAVADAMAAAKAEAEATAGLGGLSSDVTAFAQSIALQMAELSGQGSGKVYIDPALLAKREAARMRMRGLLLQYATTGDWPEYEILATTYLGNQLISPISTDDNKQQIPTVIEWVDTPNQCMSPKNAAARAVFDAFLEWIGSPIDDVLPVRMNVTAGGHVTERHSAPLLRVNGQTSISHVPEIANDPDSALRVKTRFQGGVGKMTHSHILGTLAAPAQQVR